MVNKPMVRLALALAIIWPIFGPARGQALRVCETTRENVVFRVELPDTSVALGDSIHILVKFTNKSKLRVHVFDSVFRQTTPDVFYDSLCCSIQANLGLLFYGEEQILPQLRAIESQAAAELCATIPTSRIPHLDHPRTVCRLRLLLTCFFVDNLRKYMAPHGDGRWEVTNANLYTNSEVVSIGELPIEVTQR
jgi:hypothetical protein